MLLLFWPAGTFDYWQAWVFIAVFVVLAVISDRLHGGDEPRRPSRRRMNAGPIAETRPVQKVVSIGCCADFSPCSVVSAFDHRFGWSTVPDRSSFVGNVLVAVGLGIAMLVIIQNSYAAANITVEADQTVVSTGLYGLVRHPMYFGGARS